MGIAVFFLSLQRPPWDILVEERHSRALLENPEAEPSISDNGGHNVHFTATGEVDTRSAILAS